MIGVATHHCQDGLLPWLVTSLQDDERARTKPGSFRLCLVHWPSTPLVRILLDECLDLRLRHQFPGHEYVTVQYWGEKGAKDGKLLDRAGDQFDVLITADGTMPFQQNLKKHKGLSAILITEGDGSIVTIMPFIHLIHAALKTIKPGEWVWIP